MTPRPNDDGKEKCAECFRNRDTTEYHIGTQTRGYNSWTTPLCKSCSKKFIRADFLVIGLPTKNGEITEIEHVTGGDA